MSDDTQTCPRRMHEAGPWEHAADLDAWTTGHGVAGQDSIGLSCSFCGSLHPDRFLELVREGWIVGPTDKSYKAYLDRPATEEDQRARKERWLETAQGQAVRRAAEAEGKTPEQVTEELDRAYRAENPMAKSAGTRAKFYYQHLTLEQQNEFIALYNERRMNVGYPGRLYVLPFFAGPSST
ncbi:hypothetical protein ACIGMX_34525 [Streptomyces aquilus]|uniref:hypothetical protein n=1 Tax=Streptomyces aquilus TaxID=2548456 RepID=UPI0037D74AD2